jgi:hypothetical protein
MKRIADDYLNIVLGFNGYFLNNQAEVDFVDSIYEVRRSMNCI